MPLLDVSFMAVHPMFADKFDVRRRLNIVRDDGRVDAEGDMLFNDTIGTITQQDPADIIRLEDGQMVPKQIFIATKLQLIGVAQDCQPDEVTWNGIVYTVKQVFPYSRFGAGFYEAIAEFRGAVPPAQ